MIHQVVVPRATLRRATRAVNLLEEARRRAKLLVSQANEEANDCRAHALSEGYEAGLAQAAELVARYFAQCEHWRATLYDQAVDAVQLILATHLNEPLWLSRVTDEFVRQRDAYRALPMHIGLPSHAKALGPALRRQLVQAEVSAEITYIDSPIFTIEWGDEVVEFDAANAADTVVHRALSIVDHALMPTGDDALARRFLEHTLRQLDVAPISAESRSDDHVSHRTA
ncbi:hypothetical protein [Burkholderia ubonensis]|uniref:hypothetical protein n=1 Tax=Burkholderia ubonensis TaxID=101571 RepID=UPI0012FA4197|nr:hypothetical protein [Burkholderia ubonensis]